MIHRDDTRNYSLVAPFKLPERKVYATRRGAIRAAVRREEVAAALKRADTTGAMPC